MIHVKQFQLSAIAASALCVAAMAVAAPPTHQAAFKAARTVDGQPDLQGIWTNATITPLERPKKFGDRLVLTDAEAKDMEKTEAGANEAGNAPTDPKLGIKDLPVNCGKGFTGVDCGYNSFWVDAGTRVIDINGEKRSSIVVDPADGRVPALTPERATAMAALYRNMRSNFDGPEARPLGERCLLSFGSSSGPPMLPSLYNNHYQIVQNKDTVLIEVEMVHDVRTIRLGGKHLPSNIRKWMGDSIGHWEGNTLVVETTNFKKQQFFRGATENLKVTERFTRIGPSTIDYKFTIDDPAAFTHEWTGQVPLHATNEKIFEYACHEGNYALPGILGGARADEKKATMKTETTKS